MPKVTYQNKIELLEAYIKNPRGIKDVAILRAIKVDVVKGTSPSVKRGSQAPDIDPVYNQAMGLYRAFMQKQDSVLDLKGRKARDYKEALTNLLSWIRTYQQKGKGTSNALVLKGVAYIFDNWDKLTEFHQKRIGLPDIYKNIEEIIKQIKDGKITKAKKGEQAKIGGDFGKF